MSVQIRTALVVWSLLAVVGCGQEGPAQPPRRAADAGAPQPSADAAKAPDGAGGGAPDVETNDWAADPLRAIARMEDARRLLRPVVDQYLKSPDVVVRRRTLLALGRIGDVEALGPLRASLTDSDDDARRVALISLGQLEAQAHPDVERVLTAFLELSSRPPDRKAAVEALGRVASSESVGILLTNLESPDPSMRAAAAQAFGHMANRDAVPGPQALLALASHLEDGDASVRLSAAFALSRCKELDTSTLEALGGALTRALRRDDDAEVRIMAGRALGALGAGQAGYILAALQHDDDWRVRTAAATALGKRATTKQRARALDIVWKRIMDDPNRANSSELHPLMALLDEAAERPAAELGRALRVIELNSASLMAELADDSLKTTLANVQCSAALAQDRVKGVPARVRRCAATEPPLISDWERQKLIVAALMGSTAAGALKQAKVLAGHEDARVRLIALEAIASAMTRGRLRVLEKALADESPQVVAVAAYHLGKAEKLYNPDEIEPEQKLVVTEHTEDGPVTHKLREAAVKGREPPAKALVAALKRVDPERDVETAINLLEAAGALKAVKAADALRHWTGHHNQAVRRAARAALEKLGRDPGTELRPDPPNIIDPLKLAQLESSPLGVRVETTKGSFVIELRPDAAPATVANFLGLAEKGFYAGVTFHRVVPGFVAQTGDPTGTGYGGPGYTIRCEISDLRYERGTVGMALAGADTGGSQFFIAYSAQPHLERRYTVFGKVGEGQDVVDALQKWDKILSVHKIAP